jgi:DNA polymerase
MITGDFETRGVVDLTKMGATRYATDPITQVLCFCWSYDQEEEVHLWHRYHPWIAKSERPDELIDRIKSGELFEAHNAKFEFLIWNNVLTREFPEFDVKLQMEQMRCSAAKASCLSLRRKLGDAVNDLGLEHRKDPDGQRLINKLAKPQKRKKGTTEITWCEEEVEHRRNWKYCKQDVRAERGLSNFCPEMTPRELDYWFMDFRMNMHGVRLDKVAATEAIELCAQEVTRLDAEMNQLTGGAVLGGSKRIPFRKWANERLVEIGAPLIPDTKADTLSFRLFGVPTKAAEEAKAARKDEMEAQWQGFGDKGARVKRAFEICLEVNRSSVAKFRQMVGSVAPDGRLHDIMLYNGADRTGRWSGQGVQPHNFVRGYMKDMGQETPVDRDRPELGMKPSVWDTLLTLDLDYITLIEGPALPALAKACRGALIASEGYELYAADFKAIEARKLAWMANCESQLKLFRSGGDPYLAMACAIYNREITKKNKAERQLGKKAVLGLGYAMGWEKFQATVWAEEGIWLDDKFCKRVVNIYRKITCPEMPILWKAIERAAILATQNPGEEFSAGGDPLTGDGAVTYFTSGRFLHCRLPSGRLLAYLDPEVHTKINYRFAAKNERGTPCLVTFPAKMGVPMNRVVRHAEQMAERQRKTLTGEPAESFTSPHLSFMGRHIITKEWKRLGTHGGTLTENADQASSRDLLAEAMWRVDQHEAFDLLLSIHDEVIAEAPIGTMEVPAFEALVSEVPQWASTMPVEAEGWKGPRLRK